MAPLRLFFLIFSIACTLSSFNCYGNERWVKSYSTSYDIGPEIYHVHRTKEGGVKQNGTLYGVRLAMDRIQRYKCYWGADFLWASGTLRGHIDENFLKSTFTDTNLEIRVGYSIQCKNWRCLSWTPYIGLGYFLEENFYRKPSPSTFHFHNKFGYFPVGFLSQIFIFPNFSMGLNFKARLLFVSSNKVTNDPRHKEMYQPYNEQTQYRIELPLTYFHALNSYSCSVGLTPFYEYRPYGEKFNFPYDYMRTTFKIYGASLKISVLF